MTVAEPPSSGSYALVRYNATKVPADLGVIPTRDGGASSCRLLVTGGTLVLDLAGGRFTLSRQSGNSCGGVSSPTTSTLTGLVALQGSDVRLRVPRAVGDTVEITARWDGRTFTIGRGTPEVLEYQ